MDKSFTNTLSYAWLNGVYKKILGIAEKKYELMISFTNKPYTFTIYREENQERRKLSNNVYNKNNPYN